MTSHRLLSLQEEKGENKGEKWVNKVLLPPPTQMKILAGQQQAT